jgi:UDP-N-acetylmuramoyl-tripeptide--D-alanyl-D-alanine ligase
MLGVVNPVMRGGLPMPKLAQFISQVNPVKLALLNDGTEGGPEIIFDSVSTDSRTLSPGALFVALSGPNFDANQFVAAAKSRGAVAAVVTRIDATMQAVGLPLIQVGDSLAALQRWATYWRGQWQGRLIAVAGSNGKTTVKQMVASILSAAVGDDHAWATPGNLNNHIGVPLSVLGLSSNHTLAVLELGMNHPNEIRGLATIASPHVAVVTNAQREHQEFMKTVAAAAEENGQVFTALPQDGVAIFPIDSVHEPIWIRQAGHRQMIRFGLADSFDDAFSGKEVLGAWVTQPPAPMPMLSVTFPNRQKIELQLRGIGEHFARNALAAAASAYAVGITPAVIAKALNAFAPVKGRGQVRALKGGGVLIDDSYNANPDSVRAAIDALALMTAPQALVLGDMGEVGDQGEAFHQEVLRHAIQKNIPSIWLTGIAFQSAHQHTGVGQHRDDVGQLIHGLRDWLDAQQSGQQSPSVWVKGSRFMKMERVVDALTLPTGEAATCC